MDLWVALTAITALGCGTGIVIQMIDKVFDHRRKAREQELKLAQERLRLQELQLVELHRQNEQLQKQLEWHTRLLERQGPPSRLSAPAGGEIASTAR